MSRAGSAYSFKAARSDDIGPTGPIGSTYQRINPVKEINSAERDTFWMREEAEERRRVEDERGRREEETKRLEAERQRREAEQEQVREAHGRQHEEQVRQEEDMTHADRGEELRRERNREAQDLISQRTIDARSIFERHTAAGQVLICLKYCFILKYSSCFLIRWNIVVMAKQK